VDTLATLRSRLYMTVSDYTMAKAKVQHYAFSLLHQLLQVEEASKSAYFYEDLIAAVSREDGVKRIKWSFKEEGSEREYLWEVLNTSVFISQPPQISYKPVLFRIAGIFAAIVSLFSYLGIVGSMPGVDRHVSVYFHAVHSPNSSSPGVLVFVLVTLCYTAYAAMVPLLPPPLSPLPLSHLQYLPVVNLPDEDRRNDGAAARSENVAELSVGQCACLRRLRIAHRLFLSLLDLRERHQNREVDGRVARRVDADRLR
jgi:hypothetical protein